jgi:hypothetical protein
MPPRQVQLGTFPPSGLYGAPIQARVFPNPQGIVPQDSDAPLMLGGPTIPSIPKYQNSEWLDYLFKQGQLSPLLQSQMTTPVYRGGQVFPDNPFLRQF